MQTLNLKSFPKVKLLHKASNIHHLKKLSALLEVDIYIKRDDLSEIGLGGNKLRKLEYLLGEATKKGATHILTLGAVQSNHARLTAIAATMLGFQPETFLKLSVPNESVSYQENGNIVLNQIVNTSIHKIPADSSMMQRIEARMDQIRQEGGTPYFIPVGGSNALGTLGYLDCFYEILQQQNELKINFDHIVVTSGSGGTHAGLIMGKKISQNPVKITAYNVQPEEEELIDQTYTICNEALGMLSKPSISKNDIILNTNYSGKAYGFPEDYHLEAIKLAARTEGVFLDPVYTGKTFSGMLADIQNGTYKKGEKILFIHTGGTPGIFAYSNFF